MEKELDRVPPQWWQRERAHVDNKSLEVARVLGVCRPDAPAALHVVIVRSGDRLALLMLNYLQLLLTIRLLSPLSSFTFC